MALFCRNCASKRFTSRRSQSFLLAKRLVNNVADGKRFQSLHEPVMCQEVLSFLHPRPKNLILDATFGAGGHTKAMLESHPDASVICLDRDPVSYSFAQELKKIFPDKIIPLYGKFSELPDLLSNIGIKEDSIDFMLFDFGASSMQFDNSDRGFSLSVNGPLDMRMNQNTDKVTAADVIAHAEEHDLAKIFKIYGEEKYAKKIARSIIEAKYKIQPIKTTHDLKNLITATLEQPYRTDKLSRPSSTATKVFQALRIFVNDELNEINYALFVAYKYLKIGGTVVTITFHSLEDRIVKRHLSNIPDDDINLSLQIQVSKHGAYFTQQCIEGLSPVRWQQLSKHVITPGPAELEVNPRCRSAKLRAAIKVEVEES